MHERKEWIIYKGNTDLLEDVLNAHAEQDYYVKSLCLYPDHTCLVVFHIYKDEIEERRQARNGVPYAETPEPAYARRNKR